MQGEVCWLDRMGLQEDGGRLARFLDQPGHVVREPLGVPDFEAEGPCRLKLSLAHPGALTLLTFTAHRRARSRLIIAQACAGRLLNVY